MSFTVSKLKMPWIFSVWFGAPGGRRRRCGTARSLSSMLGPWFWGPGRPASPEPSRRTKQASNPAHPTSPPGWTEERRRRQRIWRGNQRKKPWVSMVILEAIPKSLGHFVSLIRNLTKFLLELSPKQPYRLVWLLGNEMQITWCKKEANN